LGGGQFDPTRQDQMLESFENHFDRVLVHGDPALVPFDKTFRHTARLGNRLHYTGYVVEPVAIPKGPDIQGDREVLVSVGGGAVGQRLLQTALQARPLTQLSHVPWRLLAGVNASASDLEQLSRTAASMHGVVVEHYSSDFPRLLAQCRLSVSQGGYNTVMEVIQARAPAVIVPYAGGAETEQTLRTRLLAERGWIEMVEEAELNAQSLALAVDRASVRTMLPPPVRLDGARQSANIVAGWAREH
jgi:predicted glycosyltransferase